MAENATTEQTAQVQQPAPTAPEAQPAVQPEATTTPRPRIPRPHCAC